MKGQKSRKKVKKDQISNFIKYKHVVRQNEALDVKVSKKVVLRSFQFIKGQNLRKKLIKVSNLIKRIQIVHQIGLANLKPRAKRET